MRRHLLPEQGPIGSVLHRLGGSLLRKQWLHRSAGTDLLQVSRDDLVAFGHPALNADKITVGWPECDETLLGFLVSPHDVDIFSKLSRSKRGFRHHQRVGLLADADAN